MNAADEQEGERSGGDPVRTILRPLLRNPILVVAGVLGGALVGFGLGAVKPNTYESTGKLLVRVGAREEGTPESGVVRGEQGTNTGNREAVLNELHVLSSPLILDAVVRTLTPAHILAPYDPTATDGPETSYLVRQLHRVQRWYFAGMDSSGGADATGADAEQQVVLASQILSERLHIAPEVGSSVIAVSFAAHDAQLARDVVDAFLVAALSHHQRVFATDSSLAFLNTQATEALDKSAKAEDALTQYRMQCLVFDADAQRKNLMDEIHELDQELSASGARIEGNRALGKFLAGLLEKEDPTVQQTSRAGSVVNPERTFLDQRIHELQKSLVELPSDTTLTILERDNRKVSLDAQLTDAQAKLAITPEFISAGDIKTDVVNPRYDRLKTRLDDVTGEYKSSQKAFEVMQNRSTKLHEDLVRLEQCEPNLRILERDKAEASRVAEQFLQARDRVGMMNLLDRLNMINLRQLEPATLPYTKAGPRRGSILMMATVIGAALAMALAFARQALDTRLYEPEDLERHLRLRPSVCVPHIGARARIASGTR